MKTIAFLTSLATALVLTACDRASTPADSSSSSPMPLSQPVPITKTFETSRLGKAIDTYEAEPTAVNSAAVDKAFADLNVEVAELQERVTKTTGTDRDEAAAKAKNLMNYRDAETLRFAKAKAAAAGDGRSPVDSRSGAQKIEDGAKNAADKVEDAAKDTGDTLEHAAKKTGDAIKDAVH